MVEEEILVARRLSTSPTHDLFNSTISLRRVRLDLLKQDVINHE